MIRITDSTLLKVLDIDGDSFHGGDARWSLPTPNEDGTYTPGDWMPFIKKVVPCRSGYHLCQGPAHLLEWLGPAIYTVEIQGDLDTSETDKVVAHSARLLEPVTTWNERSARLFACDCAAHVLHHYEQDHPDDERPRQAIETARRYADGEATREEAAAAQAAALAAAWVAARVAAWAAAEATAGAAARAAAGATAGVAAWAAARAATEAAAWAAAWAEERAWQGGLLLQYLNGEKD